MFQHCINPLTGICDHNHLRFYARVIARCTWLIRHQIAADQSTQHYFNSSSRAWSRTQRSIHLPNSQLLAMLAAALTPPSRQIFQRRICNDTCVANLDLACILHHGYILVTSWHGMLLVLVMSVKQWLLFIITIQLGFLLQYDFKFHLQLLWIFCDVCASVM